MKVYSITFGTVLNGLKHRWKIILASTLIFALLGAGCGYLFQGRGMAEANSSARPVSYEGLDSVPRTKSYYSDCINTLNANLKALNLYLSTASFQAPLNSQSREALDLLRKEVEAFQTRRMDFLQSALIEAGAVLVPEELLDELVGYYVRELETIQFNLISAQIAAETVRQMDAPNYDSGSISSTYSELLSQALAYGNLLRNQAIYENALDQLQNQMPEVRKTIHSMDQKLKETEAELNTLWMKLLDSADKLAKEEGLIFTPTVEEGNVVNVIVTHGHRASSSQEAFAVIVLFCILVGLCTGFFSAVCLEAKDEKRQFSQPTV